MKKVISITGFILAGCLFIWHIWQTIYIDLPRGGPIQISGQFLIINLLFGGSLWLYLSSKDRVNNLLAGANELRFWGFILLVILFIQIVWGGITSGLHGGHVYNTFPKMNQYWVPPELWIMEPLYTNMAENAATAQWMHRLFGFILVFLVVTMWFRSFRVSTTFTTKKWVFCLFAFMLLQFAIGVFALIYHVPVFLGLLHQILTVVLVGVTIGFLDYVKHI